MTWLLRTARDRAPSEEPQRPQAFAAGDRLVRLIEEQQAELFARLVRARSLPLGGPATT